MKKVLIVSFAFLALILNPNQGWSTHISGVDLSMRHVGPDPNQPGNQLFVLTANLFRDCGTGSATLQNTMGICQSSACGDVINHTLTRLAGFPQDISQVCPDPNFQSECTGGTVPGYELHKYEDTISIGDPSQTCDRWTFSYQSCCRNTTNNVQGQPGFSSELVYYWDNDNVNSTPEFVATFPFPYLCLTNPPSEQTFSSAALEIEGDSVTYVINEATERANGSATCPVTHASVPYITPFTAQNPFNSPIGTNVSLTSGLVTFIPIQTGNFVVAVKVVEADPMTGDTLSTVIRDIQVVIENCNNFQPGSPNGGISNFQGTGTATGPTSLELCVGETFTFDVIIQDTLNFGIPSFDSITVAIPGQQLVMPGSVLEVIPGPPPFDTIRLSWMATPNTSPLFGFVMEISDNTCPVPGIANFEFDVRIKPSAQITAADVICLGDTLELIGSGGNVISWGTLPGGVDLNQNVNYFPANDLSRALVTPNLTTTYVLVTDNSTCQATDTFEVAIGTLPANINAEPLYCFNESPAPVLTAATPGGVWTGDGIHPTTGVLDLPTLDPGPRTGLESYDILYTFISTSGCVSTDNVTIVVANYGARLDSLPPLCEGDTSTINLRDWSFFDFGDFDSEDDIGTLLSFGDNLTRDGLLTLAGLEAGTYALTHDLDTFCTSDWDTAFTIYKPPVATILDYEAIYCTHQTDSAFFTAGDAGETNGEDFVFQWGGNTIVDPYTGAMIPSQVGAGQYALSLNVIDPVTRCSSEEVVNFKISDNPVRPRVYGQGPFCVGDRLNGLEADGLRSNRFRWYRDSSATEDSLLHRGRIFNVGEIDESFSLFATQINEDGCESYTSEVMIEVFPYPNPNFFADIYEGFELPLDVEFLNRTNDADEFVWDFGDGSVSTERDPGMHTFNELGVYNVTLTADNGVCEASITRQITADAIVKVDIPNVFTPNGDNFNDKWAPVWENIDNVQVTVLNRWGRVLHEFETPEDGWDGGDNADGTYFYIVRGIEHSLSAKPVQYSGDITLIRGN